jgi:hypothetical protein
MNIRLIKLLGLFLVISGIILAFIGIYEFQRAVIVIEWSTASELDTVGFNIYRMSSPENEKVKVNPELIPSSFDPLSGGNYQIEDENVTPGMNYIYSLEEIEINGGKNELGDIQVKAEYGGVLEGSLSIVFLIFGLLCLLLSRFYRK